MALKFSEMCAVRTDLALKLEATFDNYLDEIAQGYDAYLAPVLGDGETAPDIRLQLKLLRRKIEHHRQSIDTIDEGVLVDMCPTFCDLVGVAKNNNLVTDFE